MHNQLGGIWGEYCVEVVKSGGANYYPFGEKPLKNIIIDSFFQRILSTTGFGYGIETMVATCITSTGMGIPASRHDTGLHGILNDKTYASSGFFREIFTGENRIRMTRDFNFGILTGSRIYGEACVGMIDLSPATVFSPNMPVSHFVFPGVIQLSGGDSLKIIYSLNLIIDYLATGQRINLTGDGFNFNGTIKYAGDTGNIFSIPRLNDGITILDGSTQNQTFYGGSTKTGAQTYFRRTFTSTSSGVTVANSTAGETHLNCSRQCLFGGISDGGFTSPYIKPAFIIGYFNSGYGNIFRRQQVLNQADNVNLAAVSANNFQLYDSGASVDLNYYFPPSSQSRTCSGIFFNLVEQPSSFPSITVPNGIVYMNFDTPQTIPAQQPMQMRLRWYMNRL